MSLEVTSSASPAKTEENFQDCWTWSDSVTMAIGKTTIIARVYCSDYSPIDCFCLFSVANITSCFVCLTYGFDWCTYRNYTQNCRTTSVGVDDLLSVVRPGETCGKPLCLDGSNWGIYGKDL